MPLRTYLAVVVSVLLLAACSGGSDPDPQAPEGTGAPEAAGNPSSTSSSPAAESVTGPEVGTYKFTTKIVKSNLDGKANRVGDTEQMSLILSCTDDTCETLHLRTGAPAGSLSRAYLLTRADHGLSGRGVRVGPCTQSANAGEPGDFTETVTFDLQVDGAELTGTHEYMFQGCGFDGTASSKDRGTRTDDETPYLTDDQVAAVAPALAPYDAAVDELYTQANACFEKPDARRRRASWVSSSRGRRRSTRSRWRWTASAPPRGLADRRLPTSTSRPCTPRSTRW